MELCLWNDTTLNTRDASLRLLISLLFQIQNRGGLDHTLKLKNGDDYLVRYVRAIRARMFLARDTPKGRLLALCNRLDPPACRCGRRGTRIIGSVTFCRKCGPPERAATNARAVQKMQDNRAAMIGNEKRQRDYVTLDHESLHLARRKR